MLNTSLRLISRNRSRFVQRFNYTTKFDRESMLNEYHKNLEYYENIKGLYPVGRWIGIVNQKVVYQGRTRYEAQYETEKAVQKWVGGEFLEADPSICFQVGREHIKPQVIVIEKSQLLFHPSNTLHLDWTHVAKPIKDELQILRELDKYFVQVRFVGSDLRPYVTVAVSYYPDGPYFPMTFFVDTGSTDNYIKRSAFDFIMAQKEKFESNQKVLYIGGKKFLFGSSASGAIHSNINLVGTNCIYESPFLVDALSSAFKLSGDEKLIIQEEGRRTEPAPGDWL